MRRFETDYLSPARYDDELLVETDLTRLTGARFEMAQRVIRGEALLFTATVQIVCLDAAGRPLRIPDDIRQKIAGLGLVTAP